MKRFAIILAVLLASSPAWAAPAWVGGTLTGSGRTETLAYPATCDSTTALAINRRGTSLTNALTKYVVGAGGITATTHSPAARTNFSKILAVGCNSTTAIVAGGEIFMESAPLDDFDPWTNEQDAASVQGYGGTITATSPDKVWQSVTYETVGGKSWLYNFSLGGPKVNGNLASSTPAPGDSEIVGTSVSGTYYCSIAGEYSSGQPYMRGYTSGTSYAFTTQSPGVVMNTGSYFYPPFGLSATACVATVKRASNAQTYILSAPIGGTITRVNAGMIDLIPLGDWDPTGSLRRGWWINKADGTVRVSNSATTVASIATNATYDIGSTPLGGSTPLFAITGLDVDRDSTATDNPVVMMADGSHFAAYGECVDADGDGYPGADSMFCSTHTEDCNDADADINPGATEVCGDSIDNDCSGGDEACPSGARVVTPSSYGECYGGTYGGPRP